MSEIGEDLVGGSRPALGARQRGFVLMAAAHGRGPLPQRARDDGSDPRREPIREHGDAEPSLPQTEGTGETDDPCPDDNDCPPTIVHG